MKFVSIRQKLIKRGSLLFILSFFGVMSIVAFLNASTSQENQNNSEASIRSSLIAKGRTLVNNNSQALRGLVEDNAFTSVQDLVSSTVRDDEDIVYGIYMDIDRAPWVFARHDNPEGTVKPGEVLSDDMSLWASRVHEVSFVTTQYSGAEVYEFAAPIRSGKSILGMIRYGITTASMQRLLHENATASRQALIRTLLILLVVGVCAVAIGIFSTRRMARHITGPLQSLTDSAAIIAEGNYESEVVVSTDDEIGVLAHNFDSMRLTIKKKMADLSRINHTGEVLASLLDQDRAMHEVLKTMYEQIGMGQGTVYLLDNEGMLKARFYYPPRQQGAKGPSSFHVGEGILGRCAQTRQIVYVPDSSRDPDFRKPEDSMNPKAIVCIPLVDEDNLLGVINFSGEVAKLQFEPSDHEFSSSIARLLVITINNIRMRELIEEQNRTLEQKVVIRTQELRSTLQALEVEKAATEQAYQALDKANRQVLESIDYARRIQYAMLPDKHALGNAVKEIAVWWQPLHVVGGDYFWLEQFDHLSVILVADCTGHGVPGAFITLVLASALDRILHDQSLRSPATILASIDDMVRLRLRQNKPESDSDDGLDAGLCVWDQKARQLHFSGARLPLWLWRNGKVEEFRGDRQSLGYCTRNTAPLFNNHVVDVEPGDVFYLYTDGVPDHMGGSPRKLLGRHKLSLLIEQYADQPLSKQLSLIQSDLDSYRGDEPRRDDTTMIAFQPY